eukprot:5215_1
MVDKMQVYSSYHENQSWWSMLDCCGCCSCCSTFRMHDYNKKYDIEIESLLPDRTDAIQANSINRNDIQTQEIRKDYVKRNNNEHDVENNTKLNIDTKNDPIAINIIKGKKKTVKMKFYNKWKTKYWLQVDKILSYEYHFKISPYYGTDLRHKNQRKRLYMLLHKCFNTLPQSINQQIYGFLSTHSLTDHIYKIYFQSQQNIKPKVKSVRQLGCLVYAYNILSQYELYKEYKNTQQQEQLPNFWKYIGLNAKSTMFQVSLIFKNDTQHTIHINWISYDGTEKSNSMLYPNSITTIGTHVTNSFVIRTLLSSNNNKIDNDELKFNKLSVVAVYQIRHTYPSHIITVSSVIKPIKLKVKIGSPLRIIPVITKQYIKCKIEGFEIYYEQNIFEKYSNLFNMLTHDLGQMNQSINYNILNIMKRVPIWLNIQQNIGHQDAQIIAEGIGFHHDPRWMRNNGIMINKCYGIEMYAVKDYIKWRICQPLILFHEFVHSFHYYIGRERKDIQNTYNMAMNNHLYDMVENIVKVDEKTNQQIIQRTRAYAATNCYEYFAQISEAYFGHCNYYPFNEQQLKQHDFNGYQLCLKLWSLSAQQIQKEHIKSRKA